MHLIVTSIIPFIFAPKVDAASCYFSQVERNATSSSIGLSWSLGDCERKVDYYKVKWNLETYMACKILNTSEILSEKFEESDSNSHHLKITSPSFLLTNLSSYCEYKITVTAVDAGLTYSSNIAEQDFPIETESGIPETKPEPFLEGGTAPQAHSMAFRWKPPPPSDCYKQHGRLDGYLVELRGLDSWSDLDLTSENVQATSYSSFILKPFTRYQLRIYSHNYDGLVNKELFLTLQNRTLAATPEKPEQLTSTAISPNSVHLSWSPAHPPTGEIERYTVRQGTFQNNTSIIQWNHQFSVDTSYACKHHTSDDRSANICYVISDLKPLHKYVFQVQAKNKDVDESSSWSPSVFAETPDVEVTTIIIDDTTLLPTRSPARPRNPSDSGDVTVLIAVVVIMLSLVIICIFAIVARYKWKLKVLREQLQLEQTITMSRLDSTYNMSTLDSSFVARQGSNIDIRTPTRNMFDTSTRRISNRLDTNFLDDSSFTQTPREIHKDFSSSTIQSRRLPEPPPIGGSLPTASAPSSQGYLDMSLNRRKNVQNQPLRSNEDLEEDDSGYLKPNSRYNCTRSDDRRDEDIDDDMETKAAIVPIPASSYGTSPLHAETKSNNQDAVRSNLLQYERPDLLSTVKSDRDSSESQGSDKHLLSNN